jgi:hypothetical protein
MSIYLGTAEIDSLKLGTADVSRVMLGNAEVWSAVDPDAADYFARIVAAGSSISVDNKAAVDAFVRGCKSDTFSIDISGNIVAGTDYRNWDMIKAACFLAGPDNLTGALVPLVGAAPTNVGGLFVSGDYNRTTGLIGNGTTKYLNSNRNNNADPRNSNHNSLYVTASGTVGFTGLGGGLTSTGSNTLGTGGGVRSRSSSLDTSITSPTGFFAISRSNASGFTVRAGGTNYPKTRSSETPANDNIAIFASIQIGSALSFSNGRYAFYSIGESLDLALLDARLATYMSALI